jgi:uncharacterized protein YjbI with pentapeptide repeats
MLRGVIAGGRFVNANLSHADLTGAAAEDCDFTNADLSGTRLLGASLRGAMFKNTRLKGSDFSNSDLFNAVFDGAHDLPPSLMEAVERRLGFKPEY